MCGWARTSFCEVAGVELSTAPKRPAGSRTVITRMTWVPYGLRTAEDPARAEYAVRIGRLLKTLLLPRLEAMESLPPHLGEVPPFPFCHPCSVNPLMVVMHVAWIGGLGRMTCSKVAVGNLLPLATLCLILDVRLEAAAIKMKAHLKHLYCTSVSADHPACSVGQDSDSEVFLRMCRWHPPFRTCQEPA